MRTSFVFLGFINLLIIAFALVAEVGNSGVLLFALSTNGFAFIIWVAEDLTCEEGRKPWKHMTSQHSRLFGKRDN